MAFGQHLKTKPLITVTRKNAATLKVKDIENFMRKAMKTMPVFWHRYYRMVHFSGRGARIYRYTPRRTKRIYSETVRMKGKRPLAPDGRPLVWSMTSLLRSRIRKFVARLNKAWVSSPLNVFNIRPRHNPRIDMRREYTTVVPRERTVLVRQCRQSMAASLVGHRKTVKFTVGK